MGAIFAIGALVLNVPKWLVVGFTSIGGAALIVAGWFILTGQIPTDDITWNAIGKEISGSFIWLFVWLALAAAGFLAQLRAPAIGPDTFEYDSDLVPLRRDHRRLTSGTPTPGRDEGSRPGVRLSGAGCGCLSAAAVSAFGASSAAVRCGVPLSWRCMPRKSAWCQCSAIRPSRTPEPVDLLDLVALARRRHAHERAGLGRRGRQAHRDPVALRDHVVDGHDLSERPWATRAIAALMPSRPGCIGP